MKRVSRRWWLAAALVLPLALSVREVWRGHRPQILRFFVERDYDAERVVNLGGWLISATEASLLRIE